MSKKTLQQEFLDSAWHAANPNLTVGQYSEIKQRCIDMKSVELKKGQYISLGEVTHSRKYKFIPPNNVPLHSTVADGVALCIAFYVGSVVGSPVLALGLFGGYYAASMIGLLKGIKKNRQNISDKVAENLRDIASRGEAITVDGAVANMTPETMPSLVCQNDFFNPFAWVADKLRPHRKAPTP